MRNVLLIAVLLPLAACDSGADIDMKNASPSEVAREMRAEGTDRFINPGKWEQTVTLVDIEAPGMPAQARDAMRQAMGDAQVKSVCLTEEQARRPKEDFFTGADQNCRYDHFKWGGGKIDLKMRCTHPSATQTMVLTGDYQPNSYAMAMTTTNTGSSPMEQMTMKMRVDAKRIGACDAATRAEG